MAEQKIVAARFLSDSEENFLRFHMRLSARPEEQKRALQNLCEYYEAGRILRDPTEIRQLVHGHIGASVILVRRWALKALSLIGHPDDFQRVVDRLKVEDDVEAQTWGITGLIRNAQDRSIEEVCDLAGLEGTSALLLAARLYAPRQWLKNHATDIRISLSSDDLTLKWATFLIGYGKAPIDLFHPKFQNDIFLAELQKHDSPEIKEYAVWALWERPDFDASHSNIDLTAIKRHEENVRKWLYRLACQSAGIVKLDADAFDQLRRDRSKKSLEGLALGVADLDPSGFDREVLEWFSIEEHPQVRENLIASMAARSADSIEYEDAVLSVFRKEATDSPLARRILATSASTPLYGKLKASVASASQLAIIEASGEQANFFGQASTPPLVIVVNGDFVMNKVEFSAGRDINSQNMVAGDMINSANAAVQNLAKTDGITGKVLADVLAMLSQTEFQEGKEEVAAAVKELARAPSEAAKKTLIDRVKSFGVAAAAAGGAIGGIDKLIDAVGALPI
ncbi:hypothetical protein [Tsuneonella rigui]|uniref:hypothetical protein n=1 Tax=Tsuneonella rigui TaxID=1708790 RepID=UPI000F7F28C3|nr:hypothetical protein [Tsuneonella rigui]